MGRGGRAGGERIRLPYYGPRYGDGGLLWCRFLRRVHGAAGVRQQIPCQDPAGQHSTGAALCTQS